MSEQANSMPDSSGCAEPAGPASTGDLRAKMRTGAVLWGGANTVSRIVKVAIQIVLAWLLDPTDYGLVAMTMAFLMVLQMLSEFGVGVAVIQKKDMPDSYASTAFWLNFGISTLMLLVAWVLAPWLAAFYKEQAVTLLVRVSAVGFLAISLRTIPMALLRKRMQFGRYAALDTIWQTSSGLLSIVFAFLGASYWSLVVPPIIMGVLMTPLWFSLTAWRPRFEFDREVFVEVFNYSKHIVAASLLLLVLNNAGFIIAGHVLDSNQAGLFKFATDNAMAIVFNFAWLIGNVVLSGFALRQDQAPALRAAYERVYRVLLASTLPIHVLLFVLAPVLFAGIFPDKWESCVPLFRVILVYAVFRALTAHIAPFYNAINRSDIIVKYYGVVMLISLPAMYAGCRFGGLWGLAWAGSALQALGALIILVITPPIMHWPAEGYLKRSWPCVLACGVAAAAAKGVNVAMDELACPAVATFVLAGAVGGLCYPLMFYFLDRTSFLRLIEDLVPDRIRLKYLGFLMRTKESPA